MIHQARLSNVPANLRTLVERFDSVAAFCRATSINRQQFNKYLAGMHEPSSRTLNRLASHFKILPNDLARDPVEFMDLVSGEKRAIFPPKGFGYFGQLAEFAKDSTESLKPFLGTYYKYFYSSIYPGKIVRATVLIYRRGETVEYLTAERFPIVEPGAQGRKWYTFFYSGTCYMLGNRLFMVDYERRQKNELTMAILMPQHRTPIKYLYGLLSGVASTTFRQPYSTRVIFEKRSDDASIKKSKLRKATVLDPGHIEISPAVTQFFNSSESKLIFGHE